MSRLTSPDWFRVITDLIYAGQNMREIARAMDVSMSKNLVQMYRNGVQPTYVRGEALIRLWSKTTGKAADEVPRVKWHPPTRLGARRNRGLR